MKNRELIFVLYLIGAIAGAAWLFYDNHRLAGVAAIEQRANELLLKTQGDNAAVNEAVLRSRENLDVSYDYLTQQSQLLKKDVDELVKLGESQSNLGLQRLSQKFQKSVQDKLDNIERFKSHNSVLKNSLRYAPVVGLQLAEIAEKEHLSPLALLYSQLVGQMQQYAAAGDDSDKIKFQRLLTRLETLEKGMPQDNFNKQIEFSMHSNTVLQELDQIRRFINLIIVDDQDNLHTLATQWQQWRKERHKEANRYNQSIYVYIAYLLIGLLGLMYWLRSVYLSLDRKVAERTKEVEDAYDQLKHSQVQMVQSEKMALLGQMIAGVAHEVNTPLGYVKNNVTLIRDLIGEYDKVIHAALQLKIDGDNQQKILAAIHDQAYEIEEDGIRAEQEQLFEDTLFGIDQIAELVVNLKNFARLDEEKIKHIDIRDCIDSSLNIAKNHVKHFQIDRRYKSKNLPLVACSPAQINQVLLNLFNNAVQAMDEATGKLIIDVGIGAKNNYVYIDVIDNGHGMDEETKAKIFTPFFTTKSAGQGTGLGLAICQQIMESHGGKIKVDSRLNQGTVFRVMLPLVSPVKRTEHTE